MEFWKNIRGLVNSLFQIGLSGPQIKNNSGVIEARNSTDTGFVIVRGNSPSGNDDLVTKGYGDANYISATPIFGSQYNSEVNDTEGSTTSDSWVTRLTMSLSSMPSGTYFLSWSCEVENSSASGMYSRVVLDSTTTLGQNYHDFWPGEPVAFAGCAELSLNGSHTITLDYRKEYPIGTGYIRNARLILWRIS